MKKEKIYSVLSELKNIWHSEKIKNHFQYETYSWPEDLLQDLRAFMKEFSGLEYFIYTQNHYLNFLQNEKYIKVFVDEHGYGLTIPIITDKWLIFIEGFDTSKSATLDNYLWKYPNISKLFYFLAWIIIWIIPTIYSFLIKILSTG